ncbi:hypothetical protein TR13x_03395 [Caloranaerobacter sp. TR13]|uniref:selenium cofactor biosynthesis protein YqeC n=1 Tax=Caloranaerobacter sp. TR13 TaxID=1302151 RepID=UPI0006D458A9|nr:selenium cofactor biosynthesis protein YqeC [Caloranaerobacter sp. TR13]KPU27593.1 hypothetical protein TR13x_03395 [Caloranaerobacter sp. TR13]
MKLFKALDIDSQIKELICFVGAGGKTTTMFKLARELKGLGCKVLVTTTTAIFKPIKEEYDNLIITNSLNLKDFDNINKGTVTVLGREISKENKLLGLDKIFIEKLYNSKLFDHILVEADGSKRKPIKAPASYEPVLPCNATKVVGLIGLDCIGRKIYDDSVHRPEIFCQITGSNIGEIIDEEKIFKIVVSDNGIFKNTTQYCARYLILNKCDTDREKRCGINIVKKVISSKYKLSKILIGQMKDNEITYIWSDKI